MKKIFTLLAFTCIFFFTSKAQEERVWKGSNSSVWDFNESNWLNPDFPLPLPTLFVSGANATFNDEALKDTVSVAGSITVNNVTFNNSTLNYVLKGSSTPTLAGTGVFIKEGSGSVKISVSNNLESGTIAKGGTIIQASNTDVNAFGKKITFEGGTVRMGDKVNSSSSYYETSIPLEMKEGTEGTIFLNRYSRWRPDTIFGAGNLRIIVTGERGLWYPTSSLKGFTGKITFEGSNEYGIADKFFIMNGKTLYDPVEAEGVEMLFSNSVLRLEKDACLTHESKDAAKTVCYEIGEITAENSDCWLSGYYSANNPVVYYKVGGLNTNFTLDASIRSSKDDATTGLPHTNIGKGVVGLIKTGTGTLKLTSGKNFISAGIDVKEGRLFISNPEDSRSGTGYCNLRDVVEVYENGVLGGTGRISGHVTVNGKLEPGEDGIGTLRIEELKTVLDTLTPGSSYKKYDLKLQAGCVTEIELGSASSFDKVIVDEVVYGGKLEIKFAATYDLKAGDEFQIFEAATFSGEFSEITLPKSGEWTWDTTALATEGKIKLVSGGGSGSSSVDSNLANNRIHIHANTIGGIVINSENENILSVSVIGMSGAVVYSETGISSNSTNINLDLQGKGKVYIVKVQTENQSVVKKIVLK